MDAGGRLGRIASPVGRRCPGTRRRHEQRHEAERHREDDPPIGAAASDSRTPTVRSFGPSAKNGHGDTIRTCHAFRTRRSGVQALLPAITPGVEGSAVASGQHAQLRDGISQDVVGVEDLDLVRSHPLAMLFDEEAGQLLQVGFPSRAPR